MKRILDFLRNATTLAAIGFLLIAALVWWVGPLIAFGGSHPLDGTEERLVALLILLFVFALIVGLRVWSPGSRLVPAASSAKPRR